VQEKKCKLKYFKSISKIFSYLAIVAGVISEADYVFIPESPPPLDWQAKLCDKLLQARKL
jgi:6-phosphofructokinase